VSDVREDHGAAVGPRFAVLQAMGGTSIQMDDVVLIEAVAEQDIEDLIDDGYAKWRDPYLDLSDEGRERAKLVAAARTLNRNVAGAVPRRARVRSATSRRRLQDGRGHAACERGLSLRRTRPASIRTALLHTDFRA
jgi:hypothetical protein